MPRPRKNRTKNQEKGSIILPKAQNLTNPLPRINQDTIVKYVQILKEMNIVFTLDQVIPFIVDKLIPIITPILVEELYRELYPTLLQEITEQIQPQLEDLERRLHQYVNDYFIIGKQYTDDAIAANNITLTQTIIERMFNYTYPIGCIIFRFTEIVGTKSSNGNHFYVTTTDPVTAKWEYLWMEYTTYLKSPLKPTGSGNNWSINSSDSIWTAVGTNNNNFTYSGITEYHSLNRDQIPPHSHNVFTLYNGNQYYMGDIVVNQGNYAVVPWVKSTTGTQSQLYTDSQYGISGSALGHKHDINISINGSHNHCRCTLLIYKRVE